jgi:hypothetical protein
MLKKTFKKINNALLFGVVSLMLFPNVSFAERILKGQVEYGNDVVDAGSPLVYKFLFAVAGILLLVLVMRIKKDYWDKNEERDPDAKLSIGKIVLGLILVTFLASPLAAFKLGSDLSGTNEVVDTTIDVNDFKGGQ